MRTTGFLSPLALFTAVASAWPSGWDALDVAQGAALIRARQDNEASTTQFDLSLSDIIQGNTATTARTSRPTDNASGDTSSGGNNDQSTNSDAQTTGKDSDGTSTGRNADKTDTASTKTFDARLPAGGVQMITPNALAGAQYYKIADYVTFGFNFTSLSVTPSAIDILATCSSNSETYTIALNHSVTDGPDATQAVTWDTGDYQSTASVPLLMGTYTLMIHDAAKDVSATPMAGYLGTWEQFTFGMYTPQPYTPLADYVCATCSGALASVERQTLGFVLGMVGLTVLSFSWFAGVAGLW